MNYSGLFTDFYELTMMQGYMLQEKNEEVVFDDGYIMIPDKPGLGIELNEEEVLKRPYQPRNLRHYTGNLTDIRPKGESVYYFKGI